MVAGILFNNHGHRRQQVALMSVLKKKFASFHANFYLCAVFK